MPSTCELLVETNNRKCNQYEIKLLPKCEKHINEISELFIYNKEAISIDFNENILDDDCLYSISKCYKDGLMNNIRIINFNNSKMGDENVKLFLTAINEGPLSKISEIYLESIFYIFRL